MHIMVKEPGGRRIDLRLPTRMLINSATATIGINIMKKQLNAEKLGEHGVHLENVDFGMLDGLTAEQARLLFREINRAKAKLRRAGLPLVEVKGSDGEEVLITL